MFRDTVSPFKTIWGLNKSILQMDYMPVSSIPLKTNIRHKTQPVNAKHMQGQCIVSERSSERSPCIFDIYLFVRRPQFERNWLRKPSTITLYLCIFQFWISICPLLPTSLPVSTPNTIHHSRLTVCLPESLDLIRCLSILFWISVCE